MTPEQLTQQTSENYARSKQLLAEAQEKLKKAEVLIGEANIRMSNAKRFEDVLRARQAKLDRAFALLNRERDSIAKRSLEYDERNAALGDSQSF